MRTIGYRSNVLVILAAAFGLVAALGRPWYAPAPADSVKDNGIGKVDSGIENLFSRLGREISSHGGTNGWDAFQTTDKVLVGLLAIAVVSALGALLPAIERPSREVVRLATFAMLGVVIVKIVDTPDAAGLVERRQGIWIALGATGIMAVSAATLCAAPISRRKQGRSLIDRPNVSAPRSNAFDSPGSSSPPG